MLVASTSSSITTTTTGKFACEEDFSRRPFLLSRSYSHQSQMGDDVVLTRPKELTQIIVLYSFY